MKITSFAIQTAIVGAMLAGCGGGGGGSSGSSTTPTGPTGTSANLQQAQTPSYATGSDQLTEFTIINNFRAANGLGPLNQNSKLDASAAAHVIYCSQNTPSDTETTGAPGFTGVTVQDRAVAQGYAGVTGEVLATDYLSGSADAPFGATAANGYLGTVYHRAVLLNQQMTDIGIGFSQFNTTLVGQPAVQRINVVNVGYSGQGQNNASAYVGVYPASGMTSVPLHAIIEEPNPFPSLTSQDQLNTNTAFPISIAVASGQTLTVTSFTVTAAGQTSSMPSTLITSTDVNLASSPNVAFLVANQAYTANTTYNVAFSGSANGTAVTKSWSFTTGSN